MTIDIERLKHDLDYWKECDPTEGGATHYDVNDGGESAWILRGNGWAYWNSREGWQSGFKPFSSSINNFIPRPSPAWDGSGYPGEGVECEFRAKGGSLNNGIDIDWTRCRVIAVTSKYAILRHIKDGIADDHECPHSLGRIEFRPLRTEKEQVVEAAVSALPKEELACFEWSAHAWRIVEALCDAGMLRMPGGEE